MTEEEIELLEKECADNNSIYEYNVRNYHYEPSGHIPEKYQELYYELQNLEQGLVDLLNTMEDKSIIKQIEDLKLEIGSYLNDISEFGLYNDLNILFDCDVHKIVSDIKKKIEKLTE